MTAQQERIRINARDSDITISIEGGAAGLTFEAIAPLTNRTNRMSMDLCRLIPADQQNEYVITFEFSRDDEPEPPPYRLHRLEAHVTDITVRLRNNGYTLEGVLVGWIGYTEAYRQYQ